MTRNRDAPALPSEPPSRLREMDWSPSCFPRPRIIQLSRTSEESSESDSDSDPSESESDSDSEPLEATVTGNVLLWDP